MSALAVFASIAVLALLIVVHELGHFLAARLQHIHVNRFSIGFGPILWKYQGTQTEYAIRAFPLGGFVGFPDDDPDSEIPPDDANLLRNRPILDRAIVISAGVVANLMFAYLVLALQFGTVGVQSGFSYEAGVTIPQVVAESAAAEAGLKPMDVVVEAAGVRLPASQASLEQFKEIISDRPNRPLDLQILRGDRAIALRVTPRPDAEGKGLIGVRLLPNGKPTYRTAQNPVEVLSLAAEKFQSLFVGTVQGFVQLATNFQNTVGQVAGPVKIVEQGASLAKSDATNLFFFAAIISINLAIINILPLPALDGGQLLFLAVEGMRGKPIPTEIQDNVMQSGLLLLLGLGIFLIVRDTSQLEVVRDLLQ